jgi:outer membrane protein OmpU
MKRTLFGTTAICAIAATPVFAQSANEPIKLGFGGYWNSAYGYIVDQSGSGASGKRKDDIQTDGVVQVKGSTKFDNGIYAGVMVQFRAENPFDSTSVSEDQKTTQPDTVKKSYGYIGSDTLGQIRIGDDDDARRQKALTEPIAGGGDLFGANTSEFLFSNGPAITNTTQRKLEGDKRISRLAYFSPTVAGFSFALSYAPGGEKGGTELSLEPNTSQTNNINSVNNAVSVGLGYSGKFSDVSVDAYAGASTGHRVIATAVGATLTGRNNPTAISGGAVFGMGPIKFGGAYEYLYDRDLPNNTATVSSAHQKRNTWGVGPEYINGPFSVSLDWTRAILQNRDVNASAINDIFSLATDYILGPGVSVGAAIDYTHYHTNAFGANQVSGASYSGLALMTGVAFTF